LVLILLATWGQNPWIMMTALFGVGAFMMTAVPAIQVQLTMFAPAAPTLMGAMNLAALNTANALGAWGAGIAVGAGWGLLSAAWAGFVLTGAGLVLFLAAVRPKVLRGSATLPHAASVDHPR
jgi:DHA1 family inner membrane transport protein